MPPAPGELSCWGQGAPDREGSLSERYITMNEVDITKKKTEPRTPHLLSLNQDIVARSQ